MDPTLEDILSKDSKIYKAEEIELGDQLGKGSFGTVFKGVIKESNIEVAIKCLEQFDDKKKDWQDNIKSIINELDAMTKVETEFIPKFYGLYPYTNPQSKIECYGLIFSYIQGVTLDKFIKENPNLTNVQKLDISIKIVDIIKLLHENKITHRDIKPGNIMIKSDQSVVLLDFGVSKISEQTIAHTQGVKGTPRYSPPEVCEDTGEEDVTYEITPKFDVWSMGCLITELFSGIEPWSQKYKDNNKILLAMMKKTKYFNTLDKDVDFPYPKEFEVKFPDIYDVCKGCLVREVENRFSSTELIENLEALKEKFLEEEV